MSTDTRTTETEAHVRPIQALGRTALLSGAFSLLPVFAAVLWLAHGAHEWPVVVAIELVVTAVFFTVYIRYRRVFTAVTRTHFVKRRMLLPTVTVDRARIDRLLVNRVYRAGSPDALTQLLGVDSLGRRVLGMNALFWTNADIQRIADALEVTTIVDTVPLSRRDYYRAFPSARGWYVGRVAIVLATIAVAILLVLVVFTLETVVGSV